jgi:xylulokinase
MPLVAGVDSSTQSCKVVIIDAETGELVRSGRASHPEGTEVNPLHWWTALLAAIDDAGGIDDVAAISVGGQQHGMVLLDADGRVLRDALLWNDNRSAPEAKEIIDEFGAQFLASATGSVPVASFTSTKLRWVSNHEPDIAAQVAAVCLPHDWLTWRLAGYGPTDESQFGPDLTALATDASDASGTGYFDAAKFEYVESILRFTIGHLPILPRVISPGDFAHLPNPANQITTAGIAGGAGDNAAAGFGLGAKTGDVVVSLGTSGTVFAVSQTQTADPSGVIAGFNAVSFDSLPLVCTLNAARVLDSYCELLVVDHNELSALALQANSGSDGVVLIPYFEGERTPNLPAASASIHGLTLANNTRANLARAAVEGMLCGLADGLKALTDAGVTCERVILIGGAAASPAVQTVASEVFGVPVEVPAPGEYVAIGAARQAAWALAGELVIWSVPKLASLAANSKPQILQAYQNVQSNHY